MVCHCSRTNCPQTDRTCREIRSRRILGATTEHIEGRNGRRERNIILLGSQLSHYVATGSWCEINYQQEVLPSSSSPTFSSYSDSSTFLAARKDATEEVRERHGHTPDKPVRRRRYLPAGAKTTISQHRGGLPGVTEIACTIEYAIFRKTAIKTEWAEKEAGKNP